MAKISISASTVLYFAALAFFDGAHILPLLSAVALHETGHILCAKILNVKIKRMVLSPLGARLEIKDNISYRNEILISIAGPLLGILGFGLSLLFLNRFPYIDRFAFISLALSIFNLDFAESVMRFITFFTLFAIWLFSVYIMIKFAGGLSAFVFCMIFFSKCFIFDIKKRDFKRF